MLSGRKKKIIVFYYFLYFFFFFFLGLPLFEASCLNENSDIVVSSRKGVVLQVGSFCSQHASGKRIKAKTFHLTRKRIA